MHPDLLANRGYLVEAVHLGGFAVVFGLRWTKIEACCQQIMTTPL